MIQLTLPLAPSVNALWRITGSRMYKTKVYKDWLEEAGWMVKQQTKDSIDGEYALHIRAKKTNKRRDLDNILKATSDLLVNLHIVEDDSQCVALAAEWAKEASEPMVVTIYAMSNSNETGFRQLQ
jgi:Holliday junction resolvase RusA-like endonuclease